MSESELVYFYRLRLYQNSFWFWLQLQLHPKFLLTPTWTDSQNSFQLWFQHPTPPKIPSDSDSISTQNPFRLHPKHLLILTPTLTPPKTLSESTSTQNPFWLHPKHLPTLTPTLTPPKTLSDSISTQNSFWLQLQSPKCNNNLWCQTITKSLHGNRTIARLLNPKETSKGVRNKGNNNWLTLYAVVWQADYYMEYTECMAPATQFHFHLEGSLES
jgi:hypothetical protein